MTNQLINYPKTYAEMQDGSSKENKLLMAKAVTAMFYMLKSRFGEELNEENAMEMCRNALTELKENLRPEYSENEMLEAVIREPEISYDTALEFLKNRLINFMMENS